MMPFPFFIPRGPVHETVLPAVFDSRTSSIPRMPSRVSRQVSDDKLYFGLDLDDSYSHKKKAKAAIKY